MLKKSFGLAKNIKETSEIAKKFLDKILKNKKVQKGALVVCLSGNLGAGKTAFTQSVAKHLGIKEKVSSPTFVIMKKYAIKSKKSKTHDFLFHFDMYRLKDEQELLNLKWEEIIANPKHLIIIEWPENVKKVIPKGAQLITISMDENGHRIFEIK